ncbi:TonB-dependent receptor family protein [Fusobacterium mortiferum]|uniref:TonB-dependent receptor family protein n=1 Tax=Fusobacterium mortiferum TaxID=850 RepID=UPI000E501050|nr:TonB-dependent receptor [Fusobacterium mortiferum]RHF64096.1 TonB-dependent receptor [Fusobacterium mortiferum]
MNKKKATLLWALLAVCAYGETNSIDLGKSVIYSTTGFATETRKISASPTIVTAEEIKEKNYKSVKEALEDIPAVNIINNTFGSMIDLRGQGGLDGNSAGAKANVQILLDGVAINSLETSMVSSPINTISIDNVERIEVIPGGGSIIYGSGTSGGVINIITKKGTGTRANAGYSYTSFNGKKYDVSAGHTIGKFDIDLSYSNNEAKGYRDDSKDDSEYFQGKVRYDINDNHNVEFKYNNYNAGANILDSLTKEQLEQDRKMGDTDGFITKMDTDKDDYTLTYNGKLSSNLDINTIAFYSKTDMLMDMPSESADTKWNFKDEKKGVKTKLKYSYGNNNSIIWGIDYINNDGGRYGKVNVNNAMMSMNTKTDMDLNKDTIATFVMNTYKYNDFEFTQGIRYEKSDYEVTRTSATKITSSIPTMNKETFSSQTFTKDEDNYAWELSGSYNYSDTGRTYLRYERGFTSPGPSLLTNKYGGSYYLNNLDSQTYNSFEIGMSDYKGFTAINLSLFYSLTDKEIYTYMSSGMTNSNILNYNLDKTERYGFEIKLEQYIDKLTLSQTYQYINAEIKKGKEKLFDGNGNVITGENLSGNKIAGVPEHRFTLGAKYDFTNNFNINGEVVYNGNSYINNNNKYGKQNNYVVTNIRANYNMDNGLSLFAGINNLFDEEYCTSVSYSQSEGYTYDPAAERNYYVGFRYSL